jgi:F-type H+-transporting ATPase subunit delta
MPAPSGSARRYADAIFSIARDRGTIDAWADELTALRALATNRDGMRMLESPDLTLAQKREAVQATAGPLSPETATLVDILLQRKRVELIPALADAYNERARAHRGIELATVTTAIPLEEAERRMITDWLSARVGRSVEIEEHVDPEIIGGVVARVGDQLIDASVRGKLEQLRRRLRSDLRDDAGPA